MKREEYKYFRPKRAASWWCELEDILWPEKKIVDKINFKKFPVRQRFALEIENDFPLGTACGKLQ